MVGDVLLSQHRSVDSRCQRPLQVFCLILTLVAYAYSFHHVKDDSLALQQLATYNSFDLFINSFFGIIPSTWSTIALMLKRGCHWWMIYSSSFTETYNCYLMIVLYADITLILCTVFDKQILWMRKSNELDTANGHLTLSVGHKNCQELETMTSSSLLFLNEKSISDKIEDVEMYHFNLSAFQLARVINLSTNVPQYLE